MGLFSTHCASCHDMTPGVIVAGPSLSGIGRRASERVAGMDATTCLKRSLIAPGEYVVEGYPDLMPSTFSEVLRQEQREANIAYLQTLG